MSSTEFRALVRAERHHSEADLARLVAYAQHLVDLAAPMPNTPPLTAQDLQPVL